MSKKMVDLVERNADKELKAYFSALGEGNPLDYHDECLMLESCSTEVISSYIKRYRFSEKAEILMLEGVAPAVRMAYINFYGLCEAAQKFVIDHNLLPVAFDFMRMRTFDDVDYLLEHGDAQMISCHIRAHALKNDAQVKKLLEHSNSTLFNAYVNKGYFISDDIKIEIIETSNYSAFKALVYHYYRMFRAKAKKVSSFSKLTEQLQAFGLSSSMQVEILSSFDRMLVEFMLKTIPLCSEAQDYLFKRNFDAVWLKLHVESLYCLGGYRFDPENEVKLFKALAKKDLDDCLTTFRHQDDVSFVKYATPQTVKKYLKDFWLTDEGQVALIERGETSLIRGFLERFNSEHGICWQAEVALCKLNSAELIDFYIAFHSMCWEALEILKVSNPDLHQKYYRLHRY